MQYWTLAVCSARRALATAPRVMGAAVYFCGVTVITSFGATGLAVSSEMPRAELVSVQTADHILLHGLLYSPKRSTKRVVIHIPGGPGAFYSVQDMTPLARALIDRGWAFLTMNTRTAGSGFGALAYARFPDYGLDVAAAIELARTRGLTDVVLLGHSLGTARVAYWLAHRSAEERTAVRLRGVIFGGTILSPYQEAQLRWTVDERQHYDNFLGQERQRVASGEGRTLDAFPWAPGRTIELSAATWVSVFGAPEESDASTIKFADAIDVPILLVHGTADTTALPENARQLYAALAHAPSKDLVWIEGGDHLFRDKERQFASIVAGWVQRLSGVRPTR